MGAFSRSFELSEDVTFSDRQTKHKEYKEGLALLKSKYEEEQKLLKDDLVAKAAATKKYETDKARIQVKQLVLAAEASVQIATAAGELITKIQEAETLAVDNKFAAQLKAAKAAGEDTTALETQIEEEKKGIKKKYADIDFAITAAKIISSTALGIVKALDEFPGPVGIALGVLMGATGLAELAVANQQRLSVQQLWTGGFTNPGDKYKPAGIVHAGEFVANQEAVNHSPMRKVFNLVDHAQRTNSVARITNDDIIRSLSVRSGYANGGFVQQSPSNVYNNTVDMSAINETMRQTNAINALLISEIQKGIKANVSASGKNGVVEAVEQYNKLITNAGR